MDAIVRFLKNWMLPVSMVVGAMSYMTYHWLPALAPAGPYLLKAVTTIQPALIFVMLFLTFCKVRPSDLRLCRWHLWLLMIQAGFFTAMALALMALPAFTGREIVESAMLCLICPTATAAAVVTGKLGGDMPGLITYTVLINLVCAILVPALVPLVHPSESVNFLTASWMILRKVFPMLICPCLLAWLMMWLTPRLHAFFVKYSYMSFYIWGVGLMLAILMTTRSIVHSQTSFALLAGIAAVSLLCCIFQFWSGRKIGAHYGRQITCGQSLGQKNTVFAIWMGYTFMSPVTSVAGGFYSIWHNCYNSLQLYHKRKDSASTPSESSE